MYICLYITLIFFKGIKKYADTLSEKGGYCHFEANATYDCAICVAGMNLFAFNVDEAYDIFLFFVFSLL